MCYYSCVPHSTCHNIALGGAQQTLVELKSPCEFEDEEHSVVKGMGFREKHTCTKNLGLLLASLEKVILTLNVIFLICDVWTALAAACRMV